MLIFCDGSTLWYKNRCEVNDKKSKALFQSHINLFHDENQNMAERWLTIFYNLV